MLVQFVKIQFHVVVEYVIKLPGKFSLIKLLICTAVTPW